MMKFGYSARVALLAMLVATSPAFAAKSLPLVGIGAQYDTTHVYVAPDDVDTFAQSFIATFGGQSTKQVTVTVTPTPSSTSSQLIQTPVGTVSLFGFKTPIPFPFGAERTGYLVSDLDTAIQSARSAGANVIVAPFPDPIGRDAVIQWPGGVNMQLYWHNTAPDYPAFEKIPENRVYLSPDRVDAFLRGFLAFSHGKIVSDNKHAPGIEIGLASGTYRRVAVESAFGKMIVFVSDGHLPFPYGRDMTGYEVADLSATLTKAADNDATILVAPFTANGRQSAMVQFPGGYIAEIHAFVPATTR